MDHTKTFSTTAIIYASKESIWNYLLSEAFYKAAWGANLKTTWETGSPILFSGIWEHVKYSDKGIVEVIRANSFLKFSYWSTFWNVADIPEEYCYITFILSSRDDLSCELRIVQDGFRDEKHLNDTVKLWKETLEIIKLESEKLELININNTVVDHLIALLVAVPDVSYHSTLPNNWNIAQILEHIIISNSGIKQFLTEATSDSAIPYDINIMNIRAMMSNKKKLKSLDFLIPPLKKYDKEEQKEHLLKIKIEINECINTLDLRKTCSALEMLPFGYMSIFEWLNFSVFHMSRHYRQIETISKIT